MQKAVDEEEFSVSRAEVISKRPHDEQRKLLQGELEPSVPEKVKEKTKSTQPDDKKEDKNRQKAIDAKNEAVEFLRNEAKLLLLKRDNEYARWAIKQVISFLHNAKNKYMETHNG